MSRNSIMFVSQKVLAAVTNYHRPEAYMADIFFSWFWRLASP